MADNTSAPDGENDSQPGTIRGDRPTVSAGFSSGSSRTSRGDVPTIGAGFGPGSSGTSRGAGPDIGSGFGTPPGLGPNLSPGSSLMLNGAAYVVERLISTSTGEAEIYLLRQGDQAYVLKLYYPNFKPKDEVLAPLKQLRHDDIINLIDYGYLQGRFFETMEYAKGGTVDQHLPIRDPQQLRALIAECVNAFRFCHDHGIVHKDIKPGNLYYKGADQTDIAIGDFGISSMLDAGISRHLTSQSLTVGYAAPEMYGIRGKVYVGREVDYYALGVTLIHVWAGRSPFEGLGIHAIANLTTTGAIKVPDDLPKDLQTLVRGLTTIDFTHRWGFEEVQRWLKGEDVPVHVQASAPAYPPFHFGVRDEAASPEALVIPLKANPSTGKKLLYSGKISAWVNVFDHARASALDTIIEDDYPQDQDAGLQKAIYILDPDQPYERDKHQCRSAQELATALEDGFSFYGPLLTNPHHAFYLYLETHGAKKEADTFRSYFQTFSAKKALNATILALAGKTSVTILGREFTSPEEVLAARGQSAVVDLLKDPESQLSLWTDRTAAKTVRTRLEAWRALQICDATTLAYVSESADGVPKLELSTTRLSFSDLRPHSTSGGRFDIRNLGEGQLAGSISVDKPWLALTTTTIDPGQKTQTIAFTVDTSGFPFGATDSATVEVRTNVGIQTVTVAIAIEQGAKAIARFRNVATISATVFGALLGWGIYAASTAFGKESPSTLAGLLGVAGLGWCVGAIRKQRGFPPMRPSVVAAACGVLVGVFLHFTAATLSSVFNWSLLFSVLGFLAAPMVLGKLQSNTNRSLVASAVLLCAAIVCTVTILIEWQISQSVGQAPVASGVGRAATSTSNVAGTFVSLSPGSFVMGCSNGDSECEEDERPAHRVNITKGFEIGRYEVTQAQWRLVMGSNPSRFKGDNLPVESVSWNDIQAFIGRLNGKRDGFMYRLPTEAEWEYAARAGTAGAYWGPDAMDWYDPKDAFDSKSIPLQRTRIVGQTHPNPWGLYDTLGNVWEWTQSRWVNDYSSNPEPEYGDEPGRALRGGACYNGLTKCATRVSERIGNGESQRNIQMGFRLVRENSSSTGRVSQPISDTDSSVLVDRVEDLKTTVAPTSANSLTEAKNAPIEALLKNAEQKVESGDYEGAVAEAERAASLYPRDQRARELLERARKIKSILR